MGSCVKLHIKDPGYLIELCRLLQMLKVAMYCRLQF